MTASLVDSTTDGADDADRATRIVRRLLGVFGRLRWWVAAAALFGAVTLGAGIGLISMAGYLISRSALVDTTATLTLAIVGVRFFAVVRAVGRYLERYVGHLGTFRMLTRTRAWFFTELEPLAPAALHEERGGDVLTRMVEDVETLQDLPLRVLVPPVAGVVAGTVGAVVLGALDVRLAVCLVGFLVLSGLVLPLLGRRTTRAAAEHLAAERALANAVTVEAVGALADLVAYGREDLLVERSATLTAQRARTERTLVRLRALHAALASVVGGLAVVSALALAVPLVVDGRLEGVLLAVVPLAVMATYEAVGPLAASSEHLDHSRAAGRRLFALVDRPPAVLEPAADPERPVPSGAGRVELDDVWFRYASTGPDVLAGASCVIPAGARVALVGPSGSGKSTVAALLLRFWQPSEGALRIDGVELSAMGSDAARASIALVAQHDHLFDTSVRDNLLLGDPDADDARVWEVLAAVDLDGMVSALPGQLDERVGEDGRRLSGGERQRLMIARALLAETPVLVLDEATAHLDADTARRVLEGVRRWRHGRTTVHVVHALDGLGDLDLVLRVDGGAITPA